jgi:hypothetical protein
VILRRKMMSEDALEEIYLAFCQYRDANNLPADYDSYRQFKDAYIRDKGKEASK